MLVPLPLPLFTIVALNHDRLLPRGLSTLAPPFSIVASVHDGRSSLSLGWHQTDEPDLTHDHGPISSPSSSFWLQPSSDRGLTIRSVPLDRHHGSTHARRPDHNRGLTHDRHLSLTHKRSLAYDRGIPTYFIRAITSTIQTTTMVDS